MPLFVPAAVITVQQSDRAKLLADVEEQYELAEKKAIDTSTTEATYTLTEPKPKQILVVAETQDHLVEPNVDALTADAMKIFAKGSISITGKGVTKIRYKAVTATGKLYIWVWKAS